MDGEVLAYRCNPVNQFNAFTAKSLPRDNGAALGVSTAMLAELGVREGSLMRIAINGNEAVLPVYVDNTVSGKTVLVPSFDGPAKGLITPEMYRFQVATLTKADS